MSTEEIEESIERLVEAQPNTAALPELVEVNQGNLLVLPRFACDSPAIERLLARPAALAGIFLGLGIFFGLIYSLFINPTELNFIDPIWLPLALLLLLIAISKCTTRLADRFNCPALAELVAGALYPYGKVLSALGLPITEAHVWDQLADAAKQTGRFDDAAACVAKILSFEKPMETLYKLAENDYCWNLVKDSQRRSLGRKTSIDAGHQQSPPTQKQRRLPPSRRRVLFHPRSSQNPDKSGQHANFYGGWLSARPVCHSQTSDSEQPCIYGSNPCHHSGSGDTQN
ncbi:MAG: hypothetical protein R3F51_20730 [Cyanobacteriota/Melainabacteria group bacterium]